MAMMTPEVVHFNRADEVQRGRAETLELAYMRHPEKNVRRVPKPPVLPGSVWINRPASDSEYNETPEKKHDRAVSFSLTRSVSSVHF